MPSLMLTCLAPMELKAFIFCQVTLRDDMIKEICDSINGSPSPYVTSVKFDAYNSFERRNIKFYFAT